jgi:transposase
LLVDRGVLALCRRSVSCSLAAKLPQPNLKRRREETARGTQEQHTALVAARRWETTAEYAVLSAVRAGVEGTISQAVRGFGLRRSRYVGQAKTHLQHVAAAAAMNFVRLAEWLGGALPATTRHSKFRTVMAQGA